MKRQISAAGLLMVILFLAGCGGTPAERAARGLANGKALMGKGDYTRAVLEFKNAVSATPQDPESNYQLAIAYLRLDHTRDAIEYLQQALALNPKHVNAQLQLAELMLQSQKRQIAEQAQERVDEVIASNPDDIDAMFVKAAVDARMGRVEDAEQYLKKSLEKSPQYLKSSIALAMLRLGKKDYAGAEQAVRKAAADAPESAEAALVLGQVEAWLGKAADAETALQRVIQMDPNNGQALVSLGALYLQANRVAEAETIYKRIAALSGRQYKPVYGIFLVLQGRIDEALVEMEKLSKAYPEDREARDLLVATYMKADRLETAETILDQVLKKNPKDTDALLQRSRIAISAGKLTQAVDLLRTLLGMEPNSPAVHFFMARAYELRGSYQQQREQLASAVRAAPEWLAARIELANALMSSNQGKAALDTLDAATREQKRSINFLVARNWALISIGDLATARKNVTAGMAVAKTADLYLQDGTLKLAAKDYEGARNSLQHSLESNPDSLRTLNSLIETYAGEGHLDAGIQKVRRYIAQRPRTAGNLIFLAEWLIRAGQDADARALLESADKTSLGNTSTKRLLAELDLKEGAFGEAEQRLTAILKAEPGEPRANLLMASLKSRNGDYKKASEHYRITAAEGNVVALNNLAYNLAKDDSQLDSALGFAQRAKELAPDDSYVADTLGWIYYRKGLYQRAVKELETAFAKGGRPAVKMHLGLTYVKLGDEAKGQKLAREATDADPSLLLLTP